MRVKLERSGGFANVRRSVTVDAATLAPERAVELRDLLAAAGLDTLPEDPPSRPGRPDRFAYRLTLEDEAGARSVSVPEDTASEPLRRLIDWLQGTAEG